MGVETKYVCDRCGHTQESSDQMWNVGISYTTYHAPVRPDISYKHLWCRRCLVAAGILSSSEAERKKLDVPEPEIRPSFEDMLRSLVEEVVQENIP